VLSVVSCFDGDEVSTCWVLLMIFVYPCHQGSDSGDPKALTRTHQAQAQVPQARQARK
jgi:hypothetical protein